MFRPLRFFFQRQHLAVGVELGHPVSLGVVNVVGKNGGPVLPPHGIGKQHVQIMTIEDVVPQHQGRRLTGKKLLADDKSLGQPVRAGLHRVL